MDLALIVKTQLDLSQFPGGPYSDDAVHAVLGLRRLKLAGLVRLLLGCLSDALVDR